MSESYYAGAYWGARAESAEQCAARAEIFLSTLASADASFSHWFRQGKSRKDALKHPIEISRAALEQIIRRGKDRVVEELGFRFSAWNGASADDEAVSIDATCGGHSKRVGNFCFLQLPHGGPSAERLLTARSLEVLVRAMAMAWEPDSAVATSATHRDTVTSTPKPGTFVGWVTYFARHLGEVPPLPAPVRIEPVEDKGTLVVLTPERFTASNPAHVALAEQVRELWVRAGLLKPLQR
ncbi:immunity 52 family protein [Myxococcus sp. K38C18041901]|uniref:immunity 52 family protein n=1 Tax=Myxococcus guangdongensis TaxID=2906760 RepID=UPI0020A78B2A|nr:immunity 52 family protein [Myxococcus guangdongensis]MCP3059066.1 immunity 52 family protein [Myxococcus guangdongensis]